jgi:hypothetical protein
MAPSLMHTPLPSKPETPALVILGIGILNLKTAVGREKAVQAIDVHRE